MGFNSFNFILLFLPALLIIWFLLNRSKKYVLADIFLTGMSLYYYYTFGMSFLLILLGSILVNYALSMVIDKFPPSVKMVKVIGVIFNLSLLFYFKYLGFFMDNVSAISGTDHFTKEILMPIGISFFTFGQISFIVDRANGEAKNYTFLEYILYTAYFPKLIQGPIAFHKEMIDQFRDKSLRRFDSDRFSK
ncbi:MAG: MBOAT family protein, partial [Butyrivibrio sp.]|nr:MBOAT family protein [Butyrivibrio sp.]